MKIQGKIALITGAAKRIGRQVALSLAESGVVPVIHYGESKKEALELRSKIERMGKTAYLVQSNFFHSSKKSLESRINKFVGDVEKQVPRIDILVNNASTFCPTPVGAVSEKDWDDSFAVNLKAPFFLSQAFGVKMKKRREGKIINLVDWTILRPKERFIPYSAAKAGLTSMTAGLAKALAPHVQVLGIAPGPILPVKGSSKLQQKKVADQTLLKRYGHPEDISKTIRFFCEDTDYITGTVIYVDGGASII